MSEKSGPSGRNIDLSESNEYSKLGEEAKSIELPTVIERSDIEPHAIATGETEIVLQRHGKYARKSEQGELGSLTDVASEKAAAAEYFSKFLEQLPEDERQSVDILFVASDTQYRGAGKRSLETAIVAQEAATEVLEEQGASGSRILNVTNDLRGDGGPRPMPKMREPQMFTKSPDFVKFLEDNYDADMGLKFWIAFEEDLEKDTREQMGAEGPDEIADRMGFSVRALARYAQAYHNSNPDRRLVIWADTHYDTISPFVKRDVFGVGKEAQLLVDYGAGITIDIDSEGKAKTELGGKEYEVPLAKAAS
jgi:hypothetical protein